MSYFTWASPPNRSVIFSDFHGMFIAAPLYVPALPIYFIYCSFMILLSFLIFTLVATLGGKPSGEGETTS